MAELKAGIAPALAAALLLGVGPGPMACASDPDPRLEHAAQRRGSSHVVRAGENLYRIGKRYDIPAEVIQQANDIRDVTTLRIGQRLWIPPAGSTRAERGGQPLPQRVRGEAREKVLVAFRWPVRGQLTSRYGERRGTHEGIDIAAPRGTQVIAAEAGKVIFAGRMRDYGNMIVVKHAGDYRSVYAHVHRFHVRKGHFVEGGQRIAEVGSTGNATGPHLHFEIRDRDRPRDPMLYLP